MCKLMSGAQTFPLLNFYQHDFSFFYKIKQPSCHFAAGHKEIFIKYAA